MEWQQKAGRALKAWGRRSHWCCFRQKLFHVYAGATQPGGIFSVGTWVTTVAVEFCSQRMPRDFALTLQRERGGAARAGQREHCGSRREMCGLDVWVFFLLEAVKKTHSNRVSERYQDGPLRSNIQPINLSKGGLLSCVERKGGAANSRWCKAEVKSARRPSESPES